MRKNSALPSVGAPRLFALLLGISLVLGLAISGFAQGGPRGGINGIVKDPTGAAVPGAQVEIISQQSGTTERTITTDSDGNFSAALLPVGKYRLVATASGFSRLEAPDVEVRITETTSVTLSLQVGQVTETVTVTDVTQVQLNNPTTGQALGSETVGTLPLPTRNFLTLLTLSPGANTEMFDSAALGRGKVTINVNGQRPTQNNYQLEGINANDINLPILDNVPLPNPQTIAEFKTQTSLYDASQGRNSGGNIQVTLKSGTNGFHGDVFEFVRNDVLNANDFFNNRAGVPKPVFRQNQYGFSVGGPIYLPKFGEGGKHGYWSGRNNSFFFFNYQATRAASGAATGTNFSTNIPVLPLNRSEANLRAIFFPGGLPPGFAALNPVAVRILNLPGALCPDISGGGPFCIPTVAGTPGVAAPFGAAPALGRLVRTALGTYGDDQYVISIDHQLTKANKLTGRWFSSVNSTVQPFGGASSLPFARTIPATNRFLKIGLTSVLTSTIVNDLRLGYNRFTFDRQPREPVSLTDIGATRGNAADFPAMFQVTITGGGFSLGTGVNDDRFGAFNTFVIGDDISYTRGKHTFRAGYEGSHYELNRGNRFATRGNVTFGATAADAGGAGIPAMLGFQNFLLGRITGTQGGAGFFNFYFRATDHSAYIQDDYKFSQRLTLNFGLRYEGLSIAHDKEDKLTNLRGLQDGERPLQLIHPAVTPIVGTPGVTRCTLLDCYTHNFAPRFGFAYDIFGDQTTVLRGGYGIYYQRVSNQSLLQTTGGGGFSQTIRATPLTVALANPFPTIRPLSDFPLADPVIPRLISFNPDGSPVFNSAGGGPDPGLYFYPVRDFKPPYAQQWNLTVQRELFKGWVAEVGYVGTRGVRLIGTGRPLNQAQICTTASPCVIPAAFAQGVTVPAGTRGTVRNADGSITITASTAVNQDVRVPAQYIGLTQGSLAAQANDSQSTYHGLQASMTHRFADGLYFQAAYTFSKSIDNGSGSTFDDELNGLLHIGDFFNLRQGNRGLSDFDRTHRLVISYNYEMPFRKWLGIDHSSRFFDGWSINGVYTAQSGTPFLIYDSAAFTLQDINQSNGAYAATLRGGVPILTPGGTRERLDNYVNLAAFVPGGNCVNSQNRVVACADPDAQARAIGDLGRNVFRGPFQTNWDMSVVKITRISETTNFEFRAEFFNILNHPSFQSPQAGNFGGTAVGNYGQVDVSSGDSSIFATANRPRVIQFALKLNF